MFFKTGIITRKNYRMIICCGFLLAVSLRIAALFSLKKSTYFNTLLIDERFYHNWALQIMNGTWISHSVYEATPLPAYFMALVYKIVSPQIIWIRIINIFFGSLTCFFMCLSASEIGGRKTGILALLVSAVYAPFIFYSIVPMKTSMSVFTFSLFVWFFFRLLNNNSRSLAFLVTGLAAGIMINVRPNYSVLIPMAAMFLLFFGCRDKIPYKKITFNIALFTVGILIAVLPIIVRNYIVSGEPVFFSSQAGFNLYIGNDIGKEEPYYRPVAFASSSPFKQGIQFNIEASRRMEKN